MDVGYLIIVGLFLLYYLFAIISEKKVISEPKEIIEKFLAIALIYVGISLIYFSVTGQPFLNDSVETYNIYIFVIGFIVIVWSVPILLQEFTFFRRFVARGEKKRRTNK